MMPLLPPPFFLRNTAPSALCKEAVQKASRSRNKIKVYQSPVFLDLLDSRRRLSASLAALASSISRIARRRRLKSLLGLTSSRQSISPRSRPRIITSAEALFVATGTLWMSHRRSRSSAISLVEDSIEESRKKITISTSSYETREDICWTPYFFICSFFFFSHCISSILIYNSTIQ